MSKINSPTYFQKGNIIYYALIVMAVLLSIGFGVSTLFISELKILRNAGESVFAFSAADAGAERALYIDKVFCAEIEPEAVEDLFKCVSDNNPGSQQLSNGATYTLSVERGTDIRGNSTECPSKNYCVESLGIFTGPSGQQARRKVEISR